jgi:ribonuclease D
MRRVLADIVSLLVILVLATDAHSQAPAPAAAAVSPADQACDAQKLSTNDYETCLQQAETKVDNALSALIKSVPSSAKVKNDVLASDVAANAKARWQKNFAALAAAFRAYRNADCDDDSIVTMGYGNGGLQARLACEINETSHEIDNLKARYGLN